MSVVLNILVLVKGAVRHGVKPRFPSNTAVPGIIYQVASLLVTVVEATPPVQGAGGWCLRTIFETIF